VHTLETQAWDISIDSVTSLFLAVNEVGNWKKYGRLPTNQASVPSGCVGLHYENLFQT